MSDKPSDIDEIRFLCVSRHPHSPDESVAWLAVHRLLREVDNRQAARPASLRCAHGKTAHEPCESCGYVFVWP